LNVGLHLKVEGVVGLRGLRRQITHGTEATKPLLFFFFDSASAYVVEHPRSFVIVVGTQNRMCNRVASRNNANTVHPICVCRTQDNSNPTTTVPTTSHSARLTSGIRVAWKPVPGWEQLSSRRGFRKKIEATSMCLWFVDDITFENSWNPRCVTELAEMELGHGEPFHCSI
jgi:hypothetical protein